jgi:hypothetical protein
MEELFLLLLNRLAEVTELKTKDMDWGQLDELAESYPVLFPCALVDVPDINWNDTGTPMQQGDAKIRIKLGIEITVDSHIGSGTTAEAVAKLAPIKLVNNKLHRWKPGASSKLTRTGTRIYNLMGIKVVEMEYSVEVVEVAETA